jgi:hypothetical protein
LHHCIDAPAPTRRAQLSLSPWRPVAKAGIAVRSETPPAPRRIASRAARRAARRHRTLREAALRLVERIASHLINVWKSCILRF